MNDRSLWQLVVRRDDGKSNEEGAAMVAGGRERTMGRYSGFPLIYIHPRRWLTLGAVVKALKLSKINKT